MNERDQVIIYQTEDGQTQVDVRMENDTVWLTTNQMAMLFEREESNIRRHVINVFKEGELDKENNVHFLHVNGVKKPVPFYNLDVIISVGYRVKSQRGVKFRQWANRKQESHRALKQTLWDFFIHCGKYKSRVFLRPTRKNTEHRHDEDSHRIIQVFNDGKRGEGSQLGSNQHLRTIRDNALNHT